MWLIRTAVSAAVAIIVLPLFVFCDVNHNSDVPTSSKDENVARIGSADVPETSESNADGGWSMAFTQEDDRFLDEFLDPNNPKYGGTMFDGTGGQSVISTAARPIQAAVIRQHHQVTVLNVPEQPHPAHESTVVQLSPNKARPIVLDFEEFFDMPPGLDSSNRYLGPPIMGHYSPPSPPPPQPVPAGGNQNNHPSQANRYYPEPPPPPGNQFNHQVERPSPPQINNNAASPPTPQFQVMVTPIMYQNNGAMMPSPQQMNQYSNGGWFGSNFPPSQNQGGGGYSMNNNNNNNQNSQNFQNQNYQNQQNFQMANQNQNQQPNYPMNGQQNNQANFQSNNQNYNRPSSNENQFSQMMGNYQQQQQANYGPPFMPMEKPGNGGRGNWQNMFDNGWMPMVHNKNNNGNQKRPTIVVRPPPNTRMLRIIIPWGQRMRELVEMTGLMRPRPGHQFGGQQNPGPDQFHPGNFNRHQHSNHHHHHQQNHQYQPQQNRQY